MAGMIKFGCKNCGSPHLQDKDGKLFCASCGSVFEKNIETAEERDARILYLSRLDDAEKCLRMSPPKFGDAEQFFGDFIKAYPNNSDGYWGRLRAKYGLKYVEDINKSELKPTCYLSEYADFTSNADYKKAIELAENEKIRNDYKKKAEEIIKICKEWNEKAKSYRYDVFISFKATDDETKKSTKDTNKMRELYNLLKRNGYKVFFSPESMKEFRGKGYEPYLFNALQQSSVIIVYGSKPEYFTAEWVESEWTRFLHMQSRGKKAEGSCIVVCDGVNPIDLPARLKEIQAIEVQGEEFYNDILSLVDKALPEIAKKRNAKKEAEEKARLEAEEREKRRLEREEKQRQEEIERKKREEEDRKLEEEIQRTRRRNQQEKELLKQKRIEQHNADRRAKETARQQRKQNHISRQNQNRRRVREAFDNLLWKVSVFFKNKKTLAVIIILLIAIPIIFLLPRLGRMFGGIFADSGKDNIRDEYYDEYDSGYCNHVFGEWEIVTDSTENSQGEKQKICSECGFVDREPIPKKDHVHNIAIRPAVEATCSTVGRTEGSYCTVCELTITPQKTIPMDHSFEGDACKHCGTTDRPSVGLAMTQNGDGYTVTGMGECLDEKVVIPMTRNGLPVTEIAQKAFYGCDSITEVVIPASVKSIASYAASGMAYYGTFANCDYLKKVTILGNGKTVIGARAFENCDSLEDVYIGGGVSTIGEKAFMDSGVINLTIENGVKNLSKESFANCNRLTEVKIPDSITVIPESAFESCGQLKTVDLGNEVTRVERLAFKYSGIETIDFGEKLTYIGSAAFNSCNFTELVFPESLETIESYAASGMAYYGTFANCDYLKKVTILGNGKTVIGARAFENCDSLEDVYIGGGVATIGEKAFMSSGVINLTIENGVKNLSKQCFAECNRLTELKIPDSITVIPEAAFESCGQLRTVDLGNEVVRIEHYAFKYSGIQSIDFGEKLKYIGSAAFNSCDFTELVFPESLETIESYQASGMAYYGTFASCDYLKKVTILGNGKTVIGARAFENCDSLTEITLGSGVKTISELAFSRCSSLSTINFLGSATEWENMNRATNWREGTNVTTINYAK